jgi:Protein of unknown function (DUF1553)/Protein of unknown function (DUF1549)
MSRSRLAGWSMVIAGVVLVTGFRASIRAADSPSSAKVSSQDKGKTSHPAKRQYVDELMQDAWKAAKVKPSGVASEPEFMRRVYLDVAGRTPNVKEAIDYLESKEPGKRIKLVEYLLASPDYAKNMGTIWGNTLIGRKTQERRVNRRELGSWLRRNFGENRPWNEMAFDLITAHGSNKDNGAVNYTLAHMEFEKVPLTSITTRVFLGQQIQCTQCHNHPTNDWKQQDFWSINAFFKGVRSHDVRKTDISGAEVDDHTELVDEPSGAYASFEQRNGLVGIAFPTFLDGRKIDEGATVNRREALGKFITSSEDNQLAKAFVNRMWGHFFGRGIVHPVDDFGAHNPPSNPELLNKLAADFRDNGYDIKRLIKTITSSQAYNLSSVTIKENEKDDTLFSHMALKPMNPEQLFDSLLTATSAHKTGAAEGSEAKRDAWLRQFVTTFANDEEGESNNFQGTIPQALMMMNGELMANATGGKSGSFLANVLQASQRGTGNPYNFVVSRMYFAALGRPPSRHEMARSHEFLASSPDTIQIMEDIFWSLLNSNEFVLNH